MSRLMFVVGVGALAAVLSTPGASIANDRWEFNLGGGPGADNGPWQGGSTDNEMTPGSIQEHDMEGTADEDWIIISQRPFSSYEVRVDGMGDSLTLTTGSGDLLAVDLVESDGTVVASGYNMNPAGVDRRVTFSNNTATVNNDQQIRISSPFCGGGACGGFQESGYTIRLFDTTYNVSRFNNGGSQTTVAILQNSLDSSVSGTLHLFNPAGTLLASQPVSINGHGVAVVNTAGIPGAAGVAGSMILTNSGGYGGLSGKAIALEPSTGFTFDTTMQSRPQ
jgi:hypothetical protein